MNADWLNYHHLLYFWMVAKEGSVTRACEKLHLAQPTISGQLKKLESALGEKLYERVGRDLVLTDVGQMVYRYADEMFAIGQELGDALKGRPTGRPVKLLVGIPEVLPKLIAFRLLEPALHLEEKVQIVCREGSMEQLLSQLATHELDVVFSDSPAVSMVRIRAFNHALGECGVGLFGTAQLCRQFERGLPGSLSSAPFLLPAENTAMRRSVDEWFIDAKISPQIVGEFDDTALTPASYVTTKRIINALRLTPEVVVEVSTYTDSVGSNAYNRRLSERRAEATKQLLLKEGISASRIYTVGRGEEDPLADNATNDGRAINRRGEFHFIGGQVTP